MTRKRRTRSLRRLVSLLVLAALIALLWPLNAYLAGILPGGGREPEPERGEEQAPRPGNLRVTVLDRDTGEPVEGAEIRVETHPGEHRTATSGPDGEAVLRGVPTGPVRIEARHASGRRTAVHADGSPADALVKLLDETGRELDRTRTDASGHYDVPALPNVAAILAEARRGAPSLSRSYDLVIEEGDSVRGRLLGVKPGMLEVHAVLPTEDDRMVEFRTRWPVDDAGRYSGRLPAGARAFGMVDGIPIRLDGTERALPPTVRAAGRIVRADGTVPERIELTVAPDLDPTRSNPFPGRRLRVDRQGRFRASDLVAVPYRVVARAPGCATTIRDDVRFGSDPLLIELAPGYELEGLVLDPSGDPIEGATVRAAGLPDPAHEWPIARSNTDALGRFILDGLGGDYARVRVTAPGYHVTTRERARPGQPLRVTLQPR